MVSMIVKLLISKGGSKNSHMSVHAWEEAEKKSLMLHRALKMRIKKPGFKWVDAVAYKDLYGDIEDNRHKGHKEWTYQGEAGFYAPLPREFEFAFEEEFAAIMKSEAYPIVCPC